MSRSTHKPNLLLPFDSLRLRSKLLLISLVVLAIPWAGLEFVREMEDYLRIGQEHTLLATADAVATVLHEQPELFDTAGTIVRPVQNEKDLYAQPLDTPIILDGKDKDWKKYRDNLRRYGRDGRHRISDIRCLNQGALNHIQRLENTVRLPGRVVYPANPIHRALALDAAALAIHRFQYTNGFAASRRIGRDCDTVGACPVGFTAIQGLAALFADITAGLLLAIWCAKEFVSAFKLCFGTTLLINPRDLASSYISNLSI